MDEIRADAREAVLLAATDDEPLSIFLPEPLRANPESADRVPPQANAMQSREPSAGAFDLARGLVNAIEIRFEALKNVEHQVEARTAAVEVLNQGILKSTAHADDAVRSIKSFEPQLADLKEREQALRSIETILAAFEDRARTATTDLERHVGACEVREELMVQAAEQLGRRAAATIADLEGRVVDCEARTHTAAETMARLHDVSARTLPELNQRLTAADEKRQVIDQKITEAVQMANSLGALVQQLPGVTQCDQALARIELVVPQVQQRLKDLDETIARQTLAVAANQERADRALDDGQKCCAVVSDLESRIADLSRSHEQLNGIEERVGQLEARAADAAGEFARAARAKNDLKQEVIALGNQFRQMAEAGEDEKKKLVEFKERTERYQHDQAEKASAVLSALENRMTDINGRYQLLRRVEQQLGSLEARAQSVAAELKQAATARNGLEREIVELQKQLGRITQLGEDEAKKLVEIKQQAKRYQFEQASRATAVLSTLEIRMVDIRGGHQQLDLVEQQLKLLETRSAAAVAEVRQATSARNGIEQDVAALENQLAHLTNAAGNEAKKLNNLKQDAERYQRGETQQVSAILSGLETRMVGIGKSGQQLAAVDKQVGQLEQRATVAATAVTRSTGIRNALQIEIGELHDQLQHVTKAVQTEAKTLARLKLQAKRHRLSHASLADGDGRLIVRQPVRRRSKPWWAPTPDRLVLGGVMVALFVVVAALVGNLWLFSQADNETTAKSPLPPVLASRPLEFMPMETVDRVAPAIFSLSNEPPIDNRRAAVELLAPVAHAVISQAVAETSGSAIPAVRVQSLGNPGEPAQFIGTLVIQSDPAGATAFVNQQSVGATPVVLQDLHVGSYAVRLEYEGYQRWSTVVTVSTIHDARVTATLLRDGSR